MSTAGAAGADGLSARTLGRRRLLLLLVAGALLLGLVYFVPSWLAVRTLTSMERTALSSTPAERGLAYEEIEFPSRDGITLRGWWIAGGGPQTVIMAHGKGSVRDDPELRYLDLAAGLAQAGYNVLMFDLRGHGASDFGRFTLGLHEPRDVLGAIDVARARGATDGQIALVGFSTGAVAGLDVFVQEPGLGALVADGAWPNLRELLDRELASESPLPAFYNPGIYLVARMLYDLDVDQQVALDDVAEIVAAGRPIFMIHGTGDRYTSTAEAARFAAVLGAAPQSDFWEIDGVEHVRGFATHAGEYLARVLAFLGRALGDEA